NGSGKTTLIKLACGLIHPTSGKILIKGQEPGIESKKLIAYLPEQSYLNGWMRVGDLIAMFKDFYSDFSPEKAREMLINLHIDEKERLKTLSKGTQEKIQLILVMSRNAKLFLLDEPIGGVDPAARDYILRTIIKNYNDQATVLISTHLISDVESILDQAIFLNQGKITVNASVDTLREQNGKSLDAMFREVFRC
ncbi:MAG: ABC transporter ATP-binding protein, partial [Clostridiales bacterium]